MGPVVGELRLHSMKGLVWTNSGDVGVVTLFDEVLFVPAASVVFGDEHVLSM